MTDTWEDLRKAKEEQYFQEQNKRAIAALKNRSGEKPRLSPITGEPMEQVNLNGIIIDRCKTSGGIWLDAGELEAILNASRKDGSKEKGWLDTFIETLVGKK